MSEVHIVPMGSLGRRFVPAELLPPSGSGHWLQVVVVSDDFEVARRRHDLFLPVVGPSWVCDCPPGGEHTCSEDARRPYLYVPVSEFVHSCLS